MPNSLTGLLVLAAALIAAPRTSLAEGGGLDANLGGSQWVGQTNIAATDASSQLADATSPSIENLFGVPKKQGTAPEKPKPLEWHGHIENYTAYDYLDPGHWSRGVIRTEVGTEGGSSGLGSGLKWKINARVDFDPVYAWGGRYYPPDVRKDERYDASLRETYIDTAPGNFDIRLGKQNIIWGEMVEAFVADVVSAKDMRDFILPDFETIRIPQWAARVEYFGEKSHFEVVWLPYPSVDDIGKPGSDFYPFRLPPPPGFHQQFNSEVYPTHDLGNTNYGFRASTLQNGWDLSAFYYRSTDVSPTFYRQVTLAPVPTVSYTPRHDRIWQVGGTVGKAFQSVVAKAEAVYTSGRSFNVTDLSQPTGVVPQDTLDYIVGLDCTLPQDTRVDVQYYERYYFNHNPSLLYDTHERYVSLLVSRKIHGFQPEFFIIPSLNREDRMVRASVDWTPAANWHFTTGVVTFSGSPTGIFGRFSTDNRVYADLRRDF